MGGTSTGQTASSSITQPYAPAQGNIQALLDRIGTNPNIGISDQEQNALSGLQSPNTWNYQSYFSPQVSNLTNSLFGGGGANAQAPLINNAYQQYQNQLSPFTNQANLNPYNTPGFSDALNTMRGDIQKQVNDQFAGAGRDLSGANTMALGRGEAQGLGQLIANQYNQNAQNYLGAAGAGYGAGNTTGTLLSQLQQQYLANQQAGIGTAQAGQQFVNSAPEQQLAAAQLQQTLPYTQLGTWENLLLPVANLGTTVNQTGVNAQSPSWSQAFGNIAGGLGSLFGGAAAAYKSSDERVKEDIVPVGHLHDGQTVYSYRYVGDPTPEIGLLAQEVEKHHPEAVAEFGGIKAVDYDKATEEARAIGLFAGLKRAA